MSIMKCENYIPRFTWNVKRIINCDQFINSMFFSLNSNKWSTASILCIWKLFPPQKNLQMTYNFSDHQHFGTNISIGEVELKKTHNVKSKHHGICIANMDEMIFIKNGDSHANDCRENNQKDEIEFVPIRSKPGANFSLERFATQFCIVDIYHLQWKEWAITNFHYHLRNENIIMKFSFKNQKWE